MVADGCRLVRVLAAAAMARPRSFDADAVLGNSDAANEHAPTPGDLLTAARGLPGGWWVDSERGNSPERADAGTEPAGRRRWVRRPPSGEATHHPPARYAIAQTPS